MTIQRRINSGVLIAAFLALAFGGRALYTWQIRTAASDVVITDSPPENKAKTAAMPEQTTKTKTASTTSSETVSSCIASLQADADAKKTEYEKGTILVGFSADVTYAQAVETLASYGLTPQDPSAQTTYSDRRIITAKVPPGAEISKICLIKRDASVRYAGLNVLFRLRQ